MANFFEDIAAIGAPLLGYALGGPAGGLLGMGVAGSMGQAAANRENREAADRQMDFQQYNSNTAYQRARTDLEKAGYNPLLVGTSPASTPQGATYKAENKLQPAMTSAISAMTLTNDIQRVKNETQKTINDTGVANAQVKNLNSQTLNNLQNAGIKKPFAQGVKLLTEDFPKAANSALDQYFRPKYPKHSEKLP